MSIKKHVKLGLSALALSVSLNSVAAEDPNHHHSGAIEQLGELSGGQPGRVGPAVARSAGARGAGGAGTIKFVVSLSRNLTSRNQSGP